MHQFTQLVLVQLVRLQPAVLIDESEVKVDELREICDREEFVTLVITYRVTCQVEGAKAVETTHVDQLWTEKLLDEIKIVIENQ